MKNRTRDRARALELALVVCLALLVPRAGAAQALQAEAQAIVDRVGGTWGVMAHSIDRDQPLIAINAEEALIPASNNKVFTSVWALDALGPDHRFVTDLLVAGPIENGVLRGPVVLRGSGDPAFGYPEYEDESLDPLRTMARQLRARGVRSVTGGVIGDPTAFDTMLVGPAWPRDTGDGSASYAPRVSGLAFQRNLIWIEPQATRPGQPARLELDPPVAEIPVVSDVRTGGNRAWAVRRAGEDTIRVRGTVGSRFQRFGVGVADPALLAAAALRHALEEQGIQVQGPARVAATPEDARLVHRHVSIPVRQFLSKLNQDSDNFFAEHLWKATAHQVLGVGSYVRGGPASALHFIEHADVEPGQLYQADGSGLSAHNRASARAMVQALTYAHRQPWSELFHESLAVAADPQGTMRRLFRNSAAAGNLHAKTGYINDVRTLSGYVRAANGELIAFSFLFNGNNTAGARGVQEDLGKLLANYGS